MTDIEVIEIADKEIDQIAYALSHSPGVYDNPGLRQIYKRKYEWLAQLLSMAKRATKSCEPDWISHTDPPKSNGRYEVAMAGTLQSLKCKDGTKEQMKWRIVL